MAVVGLSLGANLGDRRSNLRIAVEKLHPCLEVGSLRVSGVYETEPVGCPEGSPSFLNAVVEFTTRLTPEALLDFMQQVERELGRPVERAVNAPRPVDLDMLYYDRVILDTEALMLPHPRMMERAFVLCPLSELRPEYRTFADALDKSGVSRLEEPLF